jgi:hypothetical protein
MNQKREEEAVNAYTKFLQTKGVSEEGLNLRTAFVKKLIVSINGQLDRPNYGNALQALIQTEGDVERQQQLNFAREFYPFLMGDIKSIARLSETYGYDLSSTKFKALPANLTWPEIDVLNSESFNMQETKLINDYTSNLQQQNLSEEELQEKVKLVKLMLLRLRDIPVESSMAYRMAVDVTLPLFNLEDIKQGFLSAVREFYTIWLDKEPDAQKLKKQEPA